MRIGFFDIILRPEGWFASDGILLEETFFNESLIDEVLLEYGDVASTTSISFINPVVFSGTSDGLSTIAIAFISPDIAYATAPGTTTVNFINPGVIYGSASGLGSTAELISNPDRAGGVGVGTTTVSFINPTVITTEIGAGTSSASATLDKFAVPFTGTATGQGTADSSYEAIWRFTGSIAGTSTAEIEMEAHLGCVPINGTSTTEAPGWYVYAPITLTIAGTSTVSPLVFTRDVIGSTDCSSTATCQFQAIADYSGIASGEATTDSSLQAAARYNGNADGSSTASLSNGYIEYWMYANVSGTATTHCVTDYLNTPSAVIGRLLRAELGASNEFSRIMRATRVPNKAVLPEIEVKTVISKELDRKRTMRATARSR